MSKVLIWCVATLVVGVGAWYFFGNRNIVPTEFGGKIAQASDYRWSTTRAGEDTASGAPRTTLSLTAGGKTYELGTFIGSCSEIQGSSWSLAEDEITGVICWWAGGGSEIGVFKESGAVVLKVGVLDEGSAEVAPSRGGYKTVITL